MKIKNISHILLILLCCTNYVNAQDWHKIDSLTSVHRIKADVVLSHFDTIQGKKLLFSLQDKDYYVIIKDSDIISKFYVRIDSVCNLITLCVVKDDFGNYCKKYAKYSKRKKHNILACFEDDKKTIKDAFDLNQYHIGYITRSANEKWTTGIPSYFVIKDIDGRRYGEYSLSSITAPSPINPNLWVYLFKNLTEQMK